MAADQAPVPDDATRHLLHLQAALAELDYATELLPAGQASPLPGPLLLVGVAPDYLGRQRALNLTPLKPDGEADFQHLILIQLFAVLPFVVAESDRPRVEAALPEINLRCSIGHFTLADAGSLLFRYNWAIPRQGLLPARTIQQTFVLFAYLLDLFLPELEAVAGPLS